MIVLAVVTVAMTMKYSHLVTDHLHRAVAKLGTNAGTSQGVNAPAATTSQGLSH
jgi:hypothetical protein